MLRDQHDLILRTLAVAAAALARLRQRLAGGAPPEDVVREVRLAQGELLGKDAQLLRMLDPATAAHTLRDPQRLNAWSELLSVEAEALAMLGNDAEAQQLRARAQALSASAESHGDRLG